MNSLPVMLKVAGKLCVVVGSGAVAARRIAALKTCGARIRVVAPDADRLDADGIEVVPRQFRTGDLHGALLVAVATDDRAVNDTIAEEATREGVLINRADDASAGDITIPAHSHHGPVTLAVSTGGVSPSAAATIHRQLNAALDPAWCRLLELVAPYRVAIRNQYADADQRQTRLLRLTDDDMLRLFKSEGEAAVRARAESLASLSPVITHPGAPRGNVCGMRREPSTTDVKETR